MPDGAPVGQPHSREYPTKTFHLPPLILELVAGGVVPAVHAVAGSEDVARTNHHARATGGETYHHLKRPSLRIGAPNRPPRVWPEELPRNAADRLNLKAPAFFLGWRSGGTPWLLQNCPEGSDERGVAVH